ncbi:MAG: hypothetical protein JETT_3174 [Candidatus Jettenia ecosi]|uniref:Uncharacterized protein n=1 Tax=Candidatus Jettenia ecosi TaxID=2494326 RepID=A0A533Q7D9_9BACT|nr:MAG: hypothetical protein JETT_3174 [Candidatus Jettenia ecosi]
MLLTHPYSNCREASVASLQGKEPTPNPHTHQAKNSIP